LTRDEGRFSRDEGERGGKRDNDGISQQFEGELQFQSPSYP
jgi:hypothetical protein